MNEQFEQDLLHDERILWKGKPETSVIFSDKDKFLIPFSLLWGGFSIFWELSALATIRSGDFMFPLFGLPFVFFGLYFIIGRFFYKNWKKKHTYYAVTNKRILILLTTAGRKIQATYINTLPDISKSVGKNEIGMVRFGNQAPMFTMYENTGMEFFSGGNTADSSTAFYDIKEADKVYKLVSDLRNE